jgi:hypothetical protein
MKLFIFSITSGLMDMGMIEAQNKFLIVQKWEFYIFRFASNFFVTQPV